ncbi:MAG: sigma-70 family RNA polymerase sigma factor [Bryobacteraceae bacterium]|jgi:RNA polymerase sigma factor (sigma-70 family)
MNSPGADWSNARLVERCLQGDDRAWRVLVDRYKNLVYSMALKFGAPHQDAADIFQAVWFDLFHELHRLRDADALQAWLVRVATHKCFQWKRERQAEGGEWEEGPVEMQAEDGGLPRDLLAELEREQLVRDAVALLPPRCREMIDLLFFEHPPLRYQDVAQRLGLAEGSIGFIRGRCLKRLKQILEERGF